MRLNITFNPLRERRAIFPLNYNYGLQSFIYRHISKKLATFLHNRGYIMGKRSFKLFTFSRLLGNFKINFPEEKIVFNGPFHFYISSPLNDFIQQFAEDLIKSGEVRLFEELLVVSSLEVSTSPPLSSPLIIKMLSPLTIYSTLFLAEGKKKTYYYSPFEKEFSRLIKENLIKKYQALYRINPSGDDFVIIPVKVTKNSEKIIKYTPGKNSYTVIKGWMGLYKLEGCPRLIHLGYEAGLGSKNSQGFGMFEVR
ncbi:CRISPR-associated endoribonuclease Cas6 [Candidatus Aerophobetes bacterium]|nr:CRISPR-associated endoribonuclease Cas6 [Candidatus Aerophobetes bacterium]